MCRRSPEHSSQTFQLLPKIRMLEAKIKNLLYLLLFTSFLFQLNHITFLSVIWGKKLRIKLTSIFNLACYIKLVTKPYFTDI